MLEVLCYHAKFYGACTLPATKAAKTLVFYLSVHVCVSVILLSNLKAFE